MSGTALRPEENAAPIVAVEDGEHLFALGLALLDEGNLAWAEEAFAHADELGDPHAAANLGVLLEERGDLDGAEAAYRRSDERGLAEGAFNLAGLLAQQGRVAEAEEAYRRAAERGDTDGDRCASMLAKAAEPASAQRTLSVDLSAGIRRSRLERRRRREATTAPRPLSVDLSASIRNPLLNRLGLRLG